MCQTVLIQEERLQIPTKRKLFGGKKWRSRYFCSYESEFPREIEMEKSIALSLLIAFPRKDILCCETFPHTPPNGPLSLSKKLSLSTSTENGLYVYGRISYYQIPSTLTEQTLRKSRRRVQFFTFFSDNVIMIYWSDSDHLERFSCTILKKPDALKKYFSCPHKL